MNRMTIAFFIAVTFNFALSSQAHSADNKHWSDLTGVYVASEPCKIAVAGFSPGLYLPETEKWILVFVGQGDSFIFKNIACEEKEHEEACVARSRKEFAQILSKFPSISPAMWVGSGKRTVGEEEEDKVHLTGAKITSYFSKYDRSLTTTKSLTVQTNDYSLTQQSIDVFEALKSSSPVTEIRYTRQSISSMTKKLIPSMYSTHASCVFKKI